MAVGKFVIDLEVDLARDKVESTVVPSEVKRCPF